MLVAKPDQMNGSAALTFGSRPISSGWPDSIRDMSGSGPFGPSFNGVWQSWQPMMLTRYAPRCTAASDSLEPTNEPPLRVAKPNTKTIAAIEAARRSVRRVVGCMKVTTATASQVKAGKEIVSCENCGRILYLGQ